MKRKKFTGINIQYPISDLILNGKKKIETRTYPIPEKLIGLPLLIIETPGKSAKFSSRIVGIIIFEGSFKYEDEKAFYKDSPLHFVDKNSPWKWTSKGKWGWKITSVKKFKFQYDAPRKKGIVYTNNIPFVLEK